MAEIELRRIWMIEGVGAKREGIPRRIWDHIEAVGAPELVMSFDTTNMWWRKDSPRITLESRLEKSNTTPDHTHDLTYGVFKETYPVAPKVTGSSPVGHPTMPT